MRVFFEYQRFTQSWIVVLSGLSVLVPVGILFKEYTKEDGQMSLSELLLISGLIAICILPVFLIKLSTRIDEQGIHYQFFPFQMSFKTITWNEISKAYVRKYDPIGEYGGWGIKAGWRGKKGKAVNVAGNIGIQLELTDGKKLLVGTQKENEANRIIAYYQSKNENHETL